MTSSHPPSSPPPAPSKLAARLGGFSPITCDAAPPPGLPVTPKKDAARGVNGWTLLSGWSYFTDGSGFHLAVPDGWTYQRIGTTYCFRNPENSSVMSLDLGRDPDDDPVKACQAEDRRLREEGRIPGYALVAVAVVPLLHKAADWDVRYQGAGGELRRATTRWVAIDGKAYALGWATPDSAWTGASSRLQMVRSTFYATRANAGAQARKG